ncbi:unnamed protein product [Penicillium manginii]
MPAATGATGAKESGTGWLAATEAARICNESQNRHEKGGRRTFTAGPPMRSDRNKDRNHNNWKESVISDVTGEGRGFTRPCGSGVTSQRLSFGFFWTSPTVLKRISRVKSVRSRSKIKAGYLQVLSYAPPFQLPSSGSFSSIIMKAKIAGRPAPSGDDFRTSKRDKRQIKRATLMSKIAKSSSKTPKRRRASKKLVANLESLADALPDAADDSHDAVSQVNIIKQNTLRHKPGAMKRREKLERVERDRFAKNMAQMSTLPTQSEPTAENTTADANPTASRWSALRNFISQTMEQQPVFKANQ